MLFLNKAQYLQQSCYMNQSLVSISKYSLQYTDINITNITKYYKSSNICDNILTDIYL